MSVSVTQFWMLAEQSQLFTEQECRSLRGDYEATSDARRQGHARTVAAWLVSQRALTTYQAKVLLSGRPGPFIFGAYRIDERAGGCCSTLRFRAVHLRTNHRVLLHIWTESSSAAWQAAAAQMDRHQTLMHPHLDRCYELVEPSTQQFAVTEDVEGQTVERLLQCGRRFPVEEACRIVHQTAQALSHLHVGQLLHGQPKPSEIVLQSNGHVKLLRQPLIVPGPAPDVTGDLPSAYLQRADYLAPELWQVGAMADVRADIYALGCTLYELITGDVPFPAEDLQSKRRRHTSEPIRPLEESRQETPAGLTNIVMFMLAKESSRRYQDASEVARRLENYLDHSRHQTHPKSRPTETFYLAQLQDADEQLPKHLKHSTMPSATQPATVPSPPPACAAAELTAPVRGPGSAALPPPVSVTVPALSALRRPQRSALRLIAFTTAGILLSLAAATVLHMRTRSTSSSDGPTLETANRQARSQMTDDPGRSLEGLSARAAANGRELVDDDGQTLWASPTEGGPVALHFVPPTARMFLVVRPRSILATAEGPRVMQALGADFVEATREFEAQTGIQLNDIERLILALTPQDVGPPKRTWVVQRCTDAPLPDATRGGGESVRGGWRSTLGRRQAFVPSSRPRLIVWGDATEIQEVIAGEGAPPLLRREMEQLRQTSDENRHVTLLTTPNFLAADGRQVLSGSREILRAPILQLLGDGIQAVSLSLHLSESFYGELRLVSTVDRVPLQLAADCQQRLQRVPQQINDYLGEIPLDPYWQKLAVRLPLMVNFLFQQTRIGVSDGCAVVNCVMPPHAAHNLFLASDLAMVSIVPATVSPSNVSATDRSVLEQVLGYHMTFELPQQSLEFALGDVALGINEAMADARLEIRIEGKDLQLEGITRNQQIRDLKLENRTIGEILTEIVVRANPVQSKAPNDPAQKLVWVADPAASASQQVILVTTRAAAERQGYRLPAPFVESGSPKVERPADKQ